MIRHLRNWTGSLLLGLMLMGAGAQQETGVAWYWWLVGIATFLLLFFIIAVAFAWNSGDNTDNKE